MQQRLAEAEHRLAFLVPDGHGELRLRDDAIVHEVVADALLAHLALAHESRIDLLPLHHLLLDQDLADRQADPVLTHRIPGVEVALDPILARGDE